MTALSTPQPEMVKVNLIGIIDAVVRAGKCYRDTHGQVDIQQLLVGNRDLAAVYLQAVEQARVFFDKGEHPALRDYDRELFETGYAGLISREIQVVYLPPATRK